MSTQASTRSSQPEILARQIGPKLLEKIVVRVRAGANRGSVTVDPVFLRLGGPSGREFRLSLAKGPAFRRGSETVFVLAGPDDGETNVAHPELNDPHNPPLQLAGIDRVFLAKGMEPIPNVRGFGEMDDRLEIQQVEVELHGRSRPKPIRFQRQGPLWLGLVCGLSVELAPTEELDD